MSKSYNFFNVISNKTRWKIIQCLREGEKSVTSITEEIKEEQSKVSHSLKILYDCNFVFCKREGKRRIYSLNHQTLDPLFLIVEKHVKKHCKNKCVKE